MPTDFTPIASLAGGALIGLSAVMLMALLGRILGATGILAGALGFGERAEWPMRVALIAGMALGPALALLLTGAWPPVEVPAGPWGLVLGGLLVGVGVTLGGGCTSGHGGCGLARLSPRSLVATSTFMLATFATVFVLRHILGA